MEIAFKNNGKKIIVEHITAQQPREEEE
jgi:hypothetical protein